MLGKGIRVIKFWALVFMIVCFSYFSILNRDPVTIHLYPFIDSFSVPLFGALFSAFGLAFVSAAVFFGLDGLSKSVHISALKRKIRKLEKSSIAADVEENFVR